MKTAVALALLVAAGLSGCYAIPVSETYVADCYDCGAPPRTRVYYGSPAYVYDYWTPLAFVTGAALGYALSDGVYVRHGVRSWGHHNHGHGHWPRRYR